jgi:hypothetical protein
MTFQFYSYHWLRSEFVKFQKLGKKRLLTTLRHILDTEHVDNKKK